MTTTKDVLAHYGVKGMKWGKRRSRAQLARARAESTNARTTYKSGAKDAPKNLTNEELKARISRMETEKKYNDLNNRSVGIGEAAAREVLVNVGKKSTTAVLTGATVYAVKEVITNHLSVGAGTAIKIPKK